MTFKEKGKKSLSELKERCKVVAVRHYLHRIEDYEEEIRKYNEEIDKIEKGKHLQWTTTTKRTTVEVGYDGEDIVALKD